MELPYYNGSTEHDGINLVNTIITRDLGWIFREQPTKDYGIDAHMEIVENRLVTGKLIALQVKTGKSYLRKKSEEGYIYRGVMKHYNYWNNHSLPVILVLCDAEERICFWVQVTEEAATISDDFWEITVPFSQVLGSSSKRKLEVIAENQTDYERRLHSLVLARSWMDELNAGNTLILESEEWVNKTSGRGSITLKVLDSHTEQETIVLDYPMIFLGLISYEQAFRKLFPWAEISVDDDFYFQYEEDQYSSEEGVWDNEDQEYMFYGTDFDEWRSNLPKIRPYEELSGEVACYRLILTLNQTGKAFLMLDDYLKSGVVKDEPKEDSKNIYYHEDDHEDGWEAEEEDRDIESEEQEHEYWQVQEEDDRDWEAEEQERDWQAQNKDHNWED